MLETGSSNLDSVVHVIQLSLTPIFLLTAMASLLGVFTTRLARVSDQVKALADKCGGEEPDALVLRPSRLSQATLAAARRRGDPRRGVRRLHLRHRPDPVPRHPSRLGDPGILFTMFGLAILCTIGALGAFLFEVLLASRGIRETVDANVQRVEF